MSSINKITLENIQDYYERDDCSLYYKDKEAENFEAASEFNLEELKAAMSHDDIEVISVSIYAQAAIETLLAQNEFEHTYSL